MMVARHQMETLSNGLSQSKYWTTGGSEFGGNDIGLESYTHPTIDIPMAVIYATSYGTEAAGEIPEDASKENSIITGGRISITAFVKDGKVNSVFTENPVAG